METWDHYIRWILHSFQCNFFSKNPNVDIEKEGYVMFISKIFWSWFWIIMSGTLCEGQSSKEPPFETERYIMAKMMKPMNFKKALLFAWRSRFLIGRGDPPSPIERRFRRTFIEGVIHKAEVWNKNITRWSGSKHFLDDVYKHPKSTVGIVQKHIFIKSFIKL